MNSSKILDEEIKDLQIASLPTRPNASVKYGGAALSADEMKAAFDKLPLFIINKFNALIEDIEAVGGVTSAIKTGILDSHTLENLFEDITSGAFCSYLIYSGKSLSDLIQEILERLDAVENEVRA